MTLVINAEIAFGLAFDIEKSPATKSGYVPAHADLGSKKRLFAELRLVGFATLMRLGFTRQLVIVGGNEGRYKDEVPAINRAEAIRAMLIDDYEIAPQLIRAIPSASNTLGNVAIIREQVGRRQHRNCAVVSSHYHLPRTQMDMVGAGLSVSLYAAEAFLLAGKVLTKEALVSQLDDGPLAERCAEEIQGVADKLTGKYRSRTDIPVSQSGVSWWPGWKNKKH